MAGGGTGLSLQPAQPTGMTGSTYNQNLQSGITDQQMREMRTGPGKDYPLMYNYSPNQWNDIVTQAGMQSPTGRPLSGSAQFYQPVYQQQYQNYNMGNPMSVASYGASPGMAYFMQNPDVGMAYNQNPYGMSADQFAQTHYQNYGRNENRAMPGANSGYSGMQMQTPFNPYTNSFQTPFSYMQQAQMQQPQTNYGPAQPIVSRSAQMRGTPNVVRRAEGGIASLVDDE